mgnify:CR=1 FL=1
MNYEKVDKCSVSNGAGVRTVLWVSGCDVHCHNCHNPQTWDFNSGIPFTDDTMQEILYDLSKPYIKGLTLSGGHPLDPHNAPKVLEIVKRVKMVFPNKVFPNEDIWIYTGYVWEDIIKDDTLKEILKRTDVLVDGAYIDELRDISLPFRGSSNQRIIDVQESLKQNQVILWKE